MRRFSRFFAALLALVLLGGMSGCAARTPQPNDGRLRVVCTLFPPYDFVRQIAGDAVDLTLLLAPGQECHSYEPTPRDILAIQDCDLFIYGGGESESWVVDMLDAIEGERRVLSLLDCVDAVEEEHPEGANAGHIAHAHGDEDEPEYDEHVWTSPRNAARIAARIADELCALDGDRAAAYRAAAADYTTQLDALDAQFRAAVTNGARRTLVFADRFPFRYFADEYGLQCLAAFPGCESNAEPSTATVARLIDRVRDERIPVVLTIEFSNGKLADTIGEATGAQKREFHSCHNLTAAEFAAGESYLSLMQKNLAVLKEALA